MAAIGPRNTKPELIVRRLLHDTGFRYRLHRKDLPGRPDLYLPKWKAVLEVQGCFWHAHDCHLFKQPHDNSEFWSAKLTSNRERDARNASAVADLGLRRLVVWQCAVTGRTRLPPDQLRRRMVDWLRGTDRDGEITGLG
jgi:DNA mismatch endonuclease (patch repair protein)